MTNPDLLKPLLARVAAGGILDESEATAAFEIIMTGQATQAQIGAFLMALRLRGEAVTEITAAARVLREKAIKVEAPADAIDTCGTGGDASGTYNISTAAAIVVAACGVPVAKHGNRALSSKAGSAEVLAALGVNIDADLSLIKESLWRHNIGFLMAPRHHAATRHVADARKELGVRTIFNLLGPLLNPADTKRQLVGVFAEQWVVPMAEVLGRLGTERAWVVHGSDGLDELTTTDISHVAEWQEGAIRQFTVDPVALGLRLASPAELKGGDAVENAAALRAVLDGASGAYRDIILLNAAAGLVLANKAADLVGGIALAAKAIDSGAARNTLAQLVAVTNRETQS